MCANEIVNKHQYELDFIAIISVLVLHSLKTETLDQIVSSFYLKQAVPLFIAVTFYLGFRSLSLKTNACEILKYWYSKNRIIKTYNRIVKPFILIYIAQLVIIFLLDRSVFLEVLTWGGVGPGSYFVYVYIQIWILIPLIFVMFLKTNRYGILILLAISILLSVICSIMNVSEGLFRLSCFRYLFIAAISWIWINRKDYKIVFLIILGLCSLLYLLVLSSNDLKPLIYNCGWSSQQWPVYFWTLLIIFFLIAVWKKNQDSYLVKMIRWMGVNSWEIFLAQMFILSFVNYKLLSTVHSQLLAQCILVAVTFSFSIGSVCFFNKKVKK